MPSIPVSPLSIRKRLLLIFFMFLLTVAVLIGRLAWIQIVQADELYEKAWEQWNRAIPTQSPRGSIYDRNDNLLAGSATVETIVAIPPRVEDPEEAARALAPVLDMPAERLKELLTMERQAVYLKRKVDEEAAREVREMELEGITFAPEGKRFYPQGTLASQVLGFVGIDQGWGGLEVFYEEELRGRDGRMFFPSDARGREIPHEIKRFMPPREGMDLYLTIDETIQYIVERELSRAMVEYEPRRVMALAMDPRTGEILAAAGKPDFDPESYLDYDPRYWNLSPVTDSFEPGSTLKLATLAAAIEEGEYRENESFYCRGYLEVAGARISCWTGRGHGSIDFLEVVQGSCNPGFITLGQRLGKEKFFDYLRAFGYGSRTGIDYPGEGRGLVFDPEAIGPVEHATSTFGQGVSVTPLQQAVAVSAMANGGNLMEPYLVKEIRDYEGSLVEENKPEVVRQVISRETSQKVTEIMKSVVEEGSGINAQIEGYDIAGKTGTAQKVGPDGRYMAGEYIVSFIGFVPADDPQILLYVAVDGATRGAQWGSQITAPLFKRIMEDVLNYMEIYPRDRTQISEVAMVDVPELVGLSMDEAAARLDTQGLILYPVGEGERIVSQNPKSGARVPVHTRVIAYFKEEELLPGQVPVPDLRGYTIAEAREITGWIGLELKVEGSGIAVEQEPQPGEVLEEGERVKVYFASLTEPEP